MQYANMKYRVRVYQHRDPESFVGPKDKYFEHFEDARTEYMNCHLDQIMECKYIEEVRFEILGSDGEYHMIFASLCDHPLAAY